MYLFIVSVHVVLCVLLVLVIILQPGKGGDMGSAFGGGGGSAALFGPQGPTNLLQRATTAVAALFMVTSVSLAWYSSRSTLANANVADELIRLQQERKAKPTDDPASVGAPAGEAAPVEVELVPVEEPAAQGDEDATPRGDGEAPAAQPEAATPE